MAYATYKMPAVEEAPPQYRSAITDLTERLHQAHPSVTPGFVLFSRLWETAGSRNVSTSTD
jgi:hypothetical protein